MEEKKDLVVKFLHDIWDLCPQSFVSIWTSNHKHTKSFFTNEIDALVEHSKKINDDIYFTVCPRKNNQGQYKIGKTSDIKYMSCFWLDIDCKNGTINHHKKDNLPDLENNIDKDFLNSIDSLIKPSYKIFTGCGYHYYWLLDMPIQIKDDSACYKMLNLSNEFQKSFKYYFEQRNFHLDSTWDLTRVLRLPDSINTKNNKKCTITEVNLDAIYSIEEIEQFIAPHKQYFSKKSRLPKSLKNLKAKQNPQTKIIVKKANQIQRPLNFQEKHSQKDNIKIFVSQNTTSKINLDSLQSNINLIYKRCNYYKNNTQTLIKNGIKCQDFISKNYCKNCIYKDYIKSPLELVNNLEIIQIPQVLQVEKEKVQTLKIDEINEIEEKILLPLSLELFIQEAKEILNTHEYFLLSFILGFSSILINANTTLKIHSNWIEKPTIKILNIAPRGSKKTILTRFFAQFLDAFEEKMQQNYKKAKFYIKNAYEIDNFAEFNPRGVSLIQDNFENYFDENFEDKKAILMNKNFNTFIFNSRKEGFLKNFENNIELQFLLQDFLIFNPDFLPSGKISNRFFSNEAKEIIYNLFLKLANPLDTIQLRLSSKAFEYFDRKISQEFYSKMQSHFEPFIIDSYYNAPIQTIHVAIILHRLKQILKSGYDDQISVDTLKEAKKIILISIKYKTALLKVEEKTAKAPEIEEIIPQPLISKPVDYKRLGEFSIDLTRLINWIGYRRQIKKMPDWNCFTIRRLYSASVAYKKRAKDAIILLEEAQNKGIGILRENNFIVFEDLFL